MGVTFAGCRRREGEQWRAPGEANHVCRGTIALGCSSSIRDPPCRRAERWRYRRQDLLAVGLILDVQSQNVNKIDSRCIYILSL